MLRNLDLSSCSLPSGLCGPIQLHVYPCSSVYFANCQLSPDTQGADPCIHVLVFVTRFLHADALGWLAYLRPAAEQLQRLDISDNPLLRLNSCSKCPHHANLSSAHGTACCCLFVCRAYTARIDCTHYSLTQHAEDKTHSAEQLLETSMLFEDAPLRLLSIHHTGMNNEDLCLLFNQLTADPEEISTQAYLTCLKLGPAVHWTSASDQQASQPVPFTTETLQHMTDMLKGLSELEVLQVWGLDAEQQARLAHAWSSIKAHPGHVTTTADSFRICISPGYTFPCAQFLSGCALEVSTEQQTSLHIAATCMLLDTPLCLTSSTLKD